MSPETAYTTLSLAPSSKLASEQVCRVLLRWKKSGRVFSCRPSLIVISIVRQNLLMFNDRQPWTLSLDIKRLNKKRFCRLIDLIHRLGLLEHACCLFSNGFF